MEKEQVKDTGKFLAMTAGLQYILTYTTHNIAYAYCICVYVCAFVWLCVFVVLSIFHVKMNYYVCWLQNFFQLFYGSDREREKKKHKFPIHRNRWLTAAEHQTWIQNTYMIWWYTYIKHIIHIKFIWHTWIFKLNFSHWFLVLITLHTIQLYPNQ